MPTAPDAAAAADNDDDAVMSISHRFLFLPLFIRTYRPFCRAIRRTSEVSTRQTSIQKKETDSCRVQFVTSRCIILRVRFCGTSQRSPATTDSSQTSHPPAAAFPACVQRTATRSIKVLPASHFRARRRSIGVTSNDVAQIVAGVAKLARRAAVGGADDTVSVKWGGRDVEGLDV